ncbi:hypothetical protein LUZ61_008840 [Rhynchospora tenuis]|uniref:Uncharacterized protein n=1 Tax=Rhynchospora tenuis TaxID=198213 RepID=A0AAD5ZW33_9POAL|nr:hypothetical protein LUZ61_008840 [Rhynchospora tenuis]
MSFFHHRFDPFNPFFACPYPGVYVHRESSPFAPPLPFSSLHYPHSPHYDPFLLSSSPYCNFSATLDLLQLDACHSCPAFSQGKKCTLVSDIKGHCNYKCAANCKPNGKTCYEHEVEIECPEKDGLHRKYKWKAGSDCREKVSMEIKGKGCHDHDASLVQSYTCDEVFADGWKCCNEGEKTEKKEEKSFHTTCEKGKAKELIQQERALIPASYCPWDYYLACRCNVVHCLRDIDAAKLKLKEIRKRFYEFLNCRHNGCDLLDTQSFSEDIKLLIQECHAIGDLQGAELLVHSMIEELSDMLEKVETYISSINLSKAELIEVQTPACAMLNKAESSNVSVTADSTVKSTTQASSLVTKLVTVQEEQAQAGGISCEFTKVTLGNAAEVSLVE